MADTSIENLTGGANFQRDDAILVKRAGFPRLQQAVVGEAYFGRMLKIPFVFEASGGGSNTWSLVDDATIRKSPYITGIAIGSNFVNISLTGIQTVGFADVYPGAQLLGVYEAGASVTTSTIAIRINVWGGTGGANVTTDTGMQADRFYGIAGMIPKSHT